MFKKITFVIIVLIILMSLVISVSAQDQPVLEVEFSCEEGAPPEGMGDPSLFNYIKMYVTTDSDYRIWTEIRTGDNEYLISTGNGSGTGIWHGRFGSIREYHGKHTIAPGETLEFLIWVHPYSEDYSWPDFQPEELVLQREYVVPLCPWSEVEPEAPEPEETAGPEVPQLPSVGCGFEAPYGDYHFGWVAEGIQNFVMQRSSNENTGWQLTIFFGEPPASTDLFYFLGTDYYIEFQVGQVTDGHYDCIQTG